jgi:hypothetical protein
MLAVALSVKQFQVGEITAPVVERAGLSILVDTQLLTAAARQACYIFILRRIGERLHVISRIQARGDALVRCPAAPQLRPARRQKALMVFWWET